MTIVEQGEQLAEYLLENSSLRALLDEALVKAYRSPVLRAARETGLLRDMLPWACPYSFEQVMEDVFWPGPG